MDAVKGISFFSPLKQTHTHNEWKEHTHTHALRHWCTFLQLNQFIAKPKRVQQNRGQGSSSCEPTNQAIITLKLSTFCISMLINWWKKILNKSLTKRQKGKCGETNWLLSLFFHFLFPLDFKASPGSPVQTGAGNELPLTLIQPLAHN